MFKRQDYINDFKMRIAGFEDSEQGFLINMFREMFSTIEPSYQSQGVAYYKDVDISKMVAIEGKKVSFFGYNFSNVLHKKVANFVSNGNTYLNIYELDSNGIFRKEVRRYPMEYDNIQRNAIEYVGYMDNAESMVRFGRSWIASIDKIIDNITIQGIASGKPINMYSSHSYVTIGKSSKGHFTYGVHNRGANGDLEFTPFRMYEDDEITQDDARELNDMLYNGRVPSDKVVSIGHTNESAMNK